MKRIALIGAALGALAGRALGSIGGSEVYQQTAQSHHNYRRKLLGRINRPSDARHWHDLEQPGQCARLQAAKDKRQRKAQKLGTWAFLSADNNRAHCDEFDNVHARLNPFYIAK